MTWRIRNSRLRRLFKKAQKAYTVYSAFTFVLFFLILAGLLLAANLTPYLVETILIVLVALAIVLIALQRLFSRWHKLHTYFRKARIHLLIGGAFLAAGAFVRGGFANLFLVVSAFFLALAGQRLGLSVFFGGVR